MDPRHVHIIWTTKFPQLLLATKESNHHGFRSMVKGRYTWSCMAYELANSYTWNILGTWWKKKNIYIYLFLPRFLSRSWNCTWMYLVTNIKWWKYWKIWLFSHQKCLAIWWLIFKAHQSAGGTTAESSARTSSAEEIVQRISWEIRVNQSHGPRNVLMNIGRFDKV